MPSRPALRIINRRGVKRAEGGDAMSEQFTVTMLGGFEVYRDGQLLDLPPSCQRLVALAALKRRAVPRKLAVPGAVADDAAGPGDGAAADHAVAAASDRCRGPAVGHAAVDRARARGVGGLVRVGGSDRPSCSATRSRRRRDHDVAAELLPLLREGALLDGWTDEWNALRQGNLPRAAARRPGHARGAHARRTGSATTRACRCEQFLRFHRQIDDTAQ